MTEKFLATVNKMASGSLWRAVDLAPKRAVLCRRSLIERHKVSRLRFSWGVAMKQFVFSRQKFNPTPESTKEFDVAVKQSLSVMERTRRRFDVAGSGERPTTAHGLMVQIRLYDEMLSELSLVQHVIGKLLGPGVRAHARKMSAREMLN
jgi:hypothetical protein